MLQRSGAETGVATEVYAQLCVRMQACSDISVFADPARGLFGVDGRVG